MTGFYMKHDTELKWVKCFMTYISVKVLKFKLNIKNQNMI